jgi:hypothetical protein
LEIVAAGAEAVLPIEEDELVVGAVIEVTGAAVPFPDGEVNVALRKVLDFPLMTGAALAVDALFEVRRGDRECRNRAVSRWGGEGGDGRRGRERAVAGVGGRAVATDTALTAVGPFAEFQFQAGDAAAVEGLPDQLRPFGGVDLVTVAAGDPPARGGSPGFGPALDVKTVNISFPSAKGCRLFCPGGGEDFFPVAVEAEGVVLRPAGELLLGCVVADEEGLPPGAVRVMTGEAISFRHGRMAVGTREFLPVVAGEAELPDFRLVKTAVEAVTGIAAAEEEGTVTAGAEQ